MQKLDLLQTPDWVWKPLGTFGLDPCAGEGTEIGRINFRESDDGLSLPWTSTWFCNPPFSQKDGWINKALEADAPGILLLPERGSAPWFGPVAAWCTAYWVMGKKINFIGGPSSNNMGTALFCFGESMVDRVLDSGLPGHLCRVEQFVPRDPP
tara:strand:- start:451 stop:909 length:459 start_codon:yes stop_codon:yes gene_type:complete